MFMNGLSVISCIVHDIGHNLIMHNLFPVSEIKAHLSINQSINRQKKKKYLSQKAPYLEEHPLCWNLWFPQLLPIGSSLGFGTEREIERAGNKLNIAHVQTCMKEKEFEAEHRIGVTERERSRNIWVGDSCSRDGVALPISRKMFRWQRCERGI